jgi:hypothetical protein
MSMADNGIQIKGHVVRAIDTPVIDVAPDVDIDFDRVAIPLLIRGTTGMTMDTSGIDVDVDDSDEIFYGALRWVITVGVSALIFTGGGCCKKSDIAVVSPSESNMFDSEGLNYYFMTNLNYSSLK